MWRHGTLLNRLTISARKDLQPCDSGLFQGEQIVVDQTFDFFEAAKAALDAVHDAYHLNDDPDGGQEGGVS